MDSILNIVAFDCCDISNQSLEFTRLNTKLNLEIDTFITLLSKANCNGFWYNKNGILNILYSGNTLFGTFNYQFINENILDTTLSNENKISNDVYFSYYEVGIWCGAPFFLKN